VLCLVNAERAAHGVPPLTLNLKLRAAAYQNANDAAAIKWWAGGGPKVHINPQTMSTPQTRIRDAEYCLFDPNVPTNENAYEGLYQGGIQFQVSTAPQAAMDFWKNSPPHLHTLLDPQYKESGVAVLLGIAEISPQAAAADGGVIIVETFGGCEKPETPVPTEAWAWGVNSLGAVGDGSATPEIHTPSSR
jgi:hypothetical protein